MRTRVANIFAGVYERFGARVKPAVIIVILASIFFVAGGGVSHNEKWRIVDIRVSGARIVDPNDIRAFVARTLSGNYYFVYARDNSRLFPRREIEQGLSSAFARIEQVNVVKLDDHTIAVEVVERKPFALWCGEVYDREMYELNDCWFIDKTGFIFDRAPVFSEGVYPEIYGAPEKISKTDYLKTQLPRMRFDLLYLVAQKLQEKLGDSLRLFIKSDGEYGVVVKKSVMYPQLAGAEIRFKDGVSADALVKMLLTALPVQFAKGIPPQKKLLYIDLRFGNKVFFGFEQ